MIQPRQELNAFRIGDDYEGKAVVQCVGNHGQIDRTSSISDKGQQESQKSSRQQAEYVQVERLLLDLIL